MKGVINPLGRTLTAVRAGSSHPGRTAGPSFMVVRTVHPLPFRPAAWALLRERLLELSAYGKELAVNPDSPTETLTRVRNALESAANALRVES